MLLPAVGTPVLCEMVTAMSANAAATTIVEAVAWLLAGLLSGVLLETEFVSVSRYPAGVPALQLTTSEKFAVAPLAMVGVVQVTTPVPPTAGVMQVHPAGTEIDWNVALAGMGAM